MPRITFVSIAGLALLLALLLGCGTLGLAVRGGLVHEQIIRFPANTRYQVIVRVGNDALPWDQRANRPTALNVWMHGRGTSWHIVNMVRIPFGQPEKRRT